MNQIYDSMADATEDEMHGNDGRGRHIAGPSDKS